MPVIDEQTIQSFRPTCAHIDLSRIRQNYRTMKEWTGKPVGAVVKANAYGHGSVKIANVLEQEGVPYFFVSSLDEAMVLRSGGITETPILVIGWTSPLFANVAAKNRIALTVFQETWLWEVDIEEPLTIHLKLDTGMNRIGIRTETEWKAFYKAVKSNPYLHIEGAFTHFATADEREEDYYRQQLYRWKKWKEILLTHFEYPLLFHVSNSAHGYRYTGDNEDMVRLGISLYGYAPSSDVTIPSFVSPALSLTSVVSHVKPLTRGEKLGYGGSYEVRGDTEWIATIPIGYADGISRSYAKEGYMLIGGKKCPIVGRICMDQLMVRVDDTVKVSDEVVLIGTQGTETITADTIGDATHTISYEVLCALSARVTRRYQS